MQNHYPVSFVLILQFDVFYGTVTPLFYKNFIKYAIEFRKEAFKLWYNISILTKEREML